MLVPAVLWKEEIGKAFLKYYYTEDMMYETGCLATWNPTIIDTPDEGEMQYAIISNDKENPKLLGFVAYRIEWYNSCARNWGLISFDRGNPTIGFDLWKEIKKLLYEYKLHRIEFRMIGGNPVEKHYDRLIERLHGRKLILHDVLKDPKGTYHDDVIYEIINDRY